MTKTFAWTKEEICKLFKTVERFRQNHQPAMMAFKHFATHFARKPHSVRNFYYAQIKVLEQNPALCQSLGINLALHQKKHSVFFTKEETNQQMGKIYELVKCGHSVRGACKTLSGGNAEQMLRLQNKFHAQKQKSTQSKVMVMPQKNSGLSEADINSLLMGLIKLVRKNAEENAEKSFMTKIKTANFELRRSFKALADKEREVEMLRANFALLVTEKDNLTKQVQALRSQNAELAEAGFQSKKVSGLKTYIKKLAKNPAVKP